MSCRFVPRRALKSIIAVKYRATPRPLPPDIGVSISAACKGTVVVLVKMGNRTVAKRRTGVNRTCEYKAPVKLGKRAGRRGNVKCLVCFLGNNQLLGASGRTSAKCSR